jgi:hypothetical protein
MAGTRRVDRVIAYTNRRGRKYYLFRMKTKTGGSRYVFRREIEGRGEPVLEMPNGYEISESVNGIVSLRKTFTSPIRKEEMDAVRSVLKNHERLAMYRVEDVRGDIVVFEPISGLTPETIEFVRSLQGPCATLDLGPLERRTQYEPVLRFRLIDEKKRKTGVSTSLKLV